jgi:hypothetical protein
MEDPARKILEQPGLSAYQTGIAMPHTVIFRIQVQTADPAPSNSSRAGLTCRGALIRL